MSGPLSVRRSDDEGFGLVETVVALLIAGIVFGALATTLVSAVQASLFGRQNQQATDFMTRELETMRALDFASLANQTADIAGDSRLTACGPALCLDVNGAAAGGQEPVVVQTGGSINPHVRVLSDAQTNWTEFTVSSYVTEMPDQPVDQARRATVVVTWTSKGTVHTRSTSSVIAFTQRGLPLPVFKLEAPITAQSANPGGDLVYDLTLTNQGAPDRWNLTLSGATSGFQLYADTNGDGAWSATDDLLLTDTTADGVVDTGRVDPSTTVRFFLVWNTNPATALGTYTTRVTATSYGQPLSASGTKFVEAVSTVTTGVVTPPPGPTPTPTGPAVPPEVTCPAPATPVFTGMHSSYNQRLLMLHNDGFGNTAIQPQMSMNQVAGDEPHLPMYSTDVDAAATGRVLTTSGAATPTGAATLALSGPSSSYADWAVTFPKKGEVDGTGIIRLWVADHAAGGATALKAVLYQTATTTSSKVFLAEVEVPLTITCAGFQEVYLQLPDVPQPTVLKNGTLGIRLVAAGSGSVRLGYDVPSQMPASLIMGVKGW